MYELYQTEDLMNQNFFVTVRLSSFRGAVLDIMEVDGYMQKCICIPLDENAIETNEKGSAWCTMFAMRQNVDNKRGTHALFPYYPKEFRDKIHSLGFKTPYVGHMRPTGYKVKYNESFKKKLIKERKIKLK